MRCPHSLRTTGDQACTFASRTFLKKKKTSVHSSSSQNLIRASAGFLQKRPETSVLPHRQQIADTTDAAACNTDSSTTSTIPSKRFNSSSPRSSRSTSLNHPDRGCAVQLQHDSHRDAELIVDSTEPDCFIDHGGCPVNSASPLLWAIVVLASRVDALHCPIDRQDSHNSLNLLDSTSVAQSLSEIAYSTSMLPDAREECLAARGCPTK